jgi:hypothetical protein
MNRLISEVMVLGYIRLMCARVHHEHKAAGPSGVPGPRLRRARDPEGDPGGQHEASYGNSFLGSFSPCGPRLGALT